MYTVPSCLLVKRTLAIFLIAELGFLGVVVVTERHTPLLRAVVQNGRLALINLSFSAVSYELVNRRHKFYLLVLVEFSPRRIPLNAAEFLA